MKNKKPQKHAGQLLYALTIALLFALNAGLNVVSAQSPVDYDADDDGLIEIRWLEQLDAIRWDLDFKSAGSYALGAVNGKSTSGNGHLHRTGQIQHNVFVPVSRQV